MAQDTVALSPTSPLFRPTPRLIGFCVVAGLFGAVAAFAFDAAVRLTEHLLLGGIAHYRPPGLDPDGPAAVIPAAFRDRLWLPVVTTLGGLLSGFIVYRWAPEAEGHGTDAAIAAYHHGAEPRSRIPFVKAISSALTIGSGGVAGREGPTAQISVGLGAILARALGLRGGERRTMLLAGMAAGLAAMFRAPLGMAIFAVEILYSGMAFEGEALLYTVIAAVSAYAFFGVFAGWERLFPIPAGLDFHHPAALLGFAVLGLLAGVLGAILPTLLYRVQGFFRRLPGPPHVKPALGGLIVGLIAVAMPEVLGTGYGWAQLALSEKLTLATLVALLLLKPLAMAITIGSGGSGGVFAPTVTMGALLGACVGTVLNAELPALGLPVAAYAVVGMAAVFAGAARTPISTLIMVAEMTGGYGLIVPAMLANVLAFVVQRALTHGSIHPTLYQSQVETPERSPLHRGVFVRRALDLLESGRLEAAEIRLPRLVSLLRFGEPVPIAAGGGARLVTVTVEEGSALAGGTIGSEVGSVEGATAVAVLRGDEMLVPRGATTIEAGDQVLLVATEPAYETLRAAAASVSAAGG